ncbi:neo-calmodulin [Drosophila montana]|uniref:neo-calmodulin n=1 Tax=Drosophila montana TaxID=40370 RepID=UPI00313D0964
MPQYMSQELHLELRRVFDKYDEDRNGSIEARDLNLIMRDVGYEPTEADLNEFIDAADVGDQRCLDYKEFLQVMAPKLRDIESDENLRKAFEVFDRKGVGYFDALDVRTVMASMGEVISETDSSLLINEMDTHNEHRVELSAFLDYMHAGGPSERASGRP